MPKLTIRPVPKPQGTCLWEGCMEQSQRMPGSDLGGMWCATHEAEVWRQWDEVLAVSPNYRRYYEGKED